MKKKPRYIVHVDMDAFFASIEQRDNPSLKGKPVIIGADPKKGKGRGVVSTCSYEARKYGISSAMPVSSAFRKCPHGIFITPRMSTYSAESERIFEILESFTPDILPISIDEAFMDISGSYSLFGKSPAETCEKIKEAIKRGTGLTASLGMAPNMMTAKIASDLKKPDGLVIVEENGLLPFLHKLPVDKLWGIGRVLKRSLHAIGVKTIGELALMKEKDIVSLFGETGRHVWLLANGSDPRVVKASAGIRSLSNEHTFEEDCGDRSVLRDTLMYLSEKVSRRLRKKELSGKTITLKIRLSDFSTYTRSETLAVPTHFADEIYRAGTEKLEEFYSPEGRSVRLLGIRVSNFSDAPLQDDFFDMTADKAEKKKHLHAAIDKIQDRFGERAIRKRG